MDRYSSSGFVCSHSSETDEGAVLIRSHHSLNPLQPCLHSLELILTNPSVPIQLYSKHSQAMFKTSYPYPAKKWCRISAAEITPVTLYSSFICINPIPSCPVPPHSYTPRHPRTTSNKILSLKDGQTFPRSQRAGNYRYKF